MEKIIDSTLIINNSSFFEKLIIEPWGEEFKIKPGDTIKLVSSGYGKWDIEYDGSSIVVSLGAGYNLSVEINDLAINTASKAIRSI